MTLTILGEPDSSEGRGTPRRFGLIAGILCFCFFFAAGGLSISWSKSSTAALGYVFLPFYAAVMSVFAFLGGWCVGYFLVWYRSPTKTGRIVELWRRRFRRDAARNQPRWRGDVPRYGPR
jgi:hypothetical protein